MVGTTDRTHLESLMGGNIMIQWYSINSRARTGTFGQPFFELYFRPLITGLPSSTGGDISPTTNIRLTFHISHPPLELVMGLINNESTITVGDHYYLVVKPRESILFGSCYTERPKTMSFILDET